MFTRIVLTLGLIGIVGCHHGRHDPAKMIDHVAHRLEKKLDLRADQKPAFDALVAKVRTEAVTRQQKARNSLLEAKRELDKPTVDVDKIAALAKERTKDRLTDEDLSQFIDEITAFYKTLDAKQQKIAVDLARDRLDWID